MWIIYIHLKSGPKSGHCDRKVRFCRGSFQASGKEVALPERDAAQGQLGSPHGKHHEVETAKLEESPSPPLAPPLALFSASKVLASDPKLCQLPVYATLTNGKRVQTGS